MGEGFVSYHRSSFSTRLDAGRLYTASHSWLCRQEDRLWRVGFTKFATRMLGEPVELDFEVEVGERIDMGRVIGWIEGFKAVTDLFCPMAGIFRGGNPLLGETLTLVQSDPYGRGWLYRMEGVPGGDCLDVDGYTAVLDATIDTMRGKNV